LGNNILDESNSGEQNDSSDGDDTPYDAWEHICADAFDDDGGFVCLVAAYFDAAFNHPQGRTASDPRIHTVAVYIAEKEDWRKLRKEWRGILKKYGDVPYFHMKDFERDRNVTKFGTGQISSKSPYKGWSLDKFNSFEKELHDTINRKKKDGSARIAAITSNVVVADYNETLPDDLKDHPECRSHFILNVVNVMAGVAVWANSTGYYEPIHYIFAGGDDDIGDLDKWFNRCFKRDLTINHYRLGKGFTRIGYDIQWMRSEPALQMVDCPAYELNRAVIEWAKQGFNPILKSELRASLSSLCRIDHFGATLRKPELLQVYADIRANDKRLGF
jgi:hypothetical protein